MINSSSDSIPTHVFAHPGTYNVSLTTYLGGIPSSTSISVVVYPYPDLQLENDTIIYHGESLTLDVPTLGGTYLWSDNSNDSVFTITQSGVYWVDVTVNSCTASDTININSGIAPPIIEANGDVLTCLGDFDSYQWYLNDTIISSATNQTFTATQSGNYSVEVMDINSCAGTSDILEFTLQTGIHMLEQSIPFQVYPNPSSGSFHVESKIATPLSVEVLNGLGQRINEQTSGDGERLTVWLKSSGIYHFRVFIANQTYVLKVVKE